MKKMCMFVMFILSVYGMFPAYATTDIAADAESSECTENITGTYSGDANFKAKWAPNNIQLNWYNNHTLMQGVNTESNTCNYGTTLTIPTTPLERIGYIFDGWKVRPKMDFSTLTSLTNGSERWARDYDNRDYCWYARTGSASETNCADSAFSDLKNKEWKAKFRSGMLYGNAYCSAKSGNNSGYTYPTNDSSNWLATYDELEIATGEKKWCWCKATGWKPSSDNPNGIIYGPSSVSASSTWRFIGTPSVSATYCVKTCAHDCSNYILTYPNPRRGLFIELGN